MKPLMPAFVLFSLLIHLLILISLTNITTIPQSGERLQDNALLSVRISSPESRPSPDTRTAPQQVLKQSVPAIRDIQRHKITAVELMQKAFNAVPAITETMERKDSFTGETVIFDRRFRKTLDNSPAKKPQIEMISDYEDYFAVRIDGRCWKIPVPDESNPFDARIVMRDFRCK